MSQMSTAVLAGDLNTPHAVAVIFLLLKTVGIKRIPKTWPAAAGMEFLGGCK
jgi:hypothetical protein